MDLDHMLPSQRPTPIPHDEQLSSASDAKLSTLEPQRLADPSALNAMPSPPIPSPPQYNPHPKYLGDHAANRSHQHSPLTLRSFNEPTTELAPIQSQNGKGVSESLPSLSSVTSGLPPSPEPRPTTYWPNLNPLAVYYSPSMQAGETPSRVDREGSSTSSERYHDRRSASVSLDDPDVRMAAEALGNLRTDFVSSPPNRNTPLPATPREQPASVSSPRDSTGDQSQEPLLSLITAYHPILATAVGVSTSAYNVYNQGKDISPQFKTGAEYLEGYLTPIAKVVGDVGRKTPLLESGARWMFRRKQSRKHQSGVDLEGGSSKRRKAQLSDKEKEAFDRSFPTDERRMSVSTIDTLPAYDDQRSPAYSEVLEGQMTRPGSSGSEWKTRIVVSTSGLGVAMRAESLVKLKYCLERLRSVNSYVGDTLNNLQSVVEQYDAAKKKTDDEQASRGASGSTSETPDDQKQLLARMDTLKKDIASTLVSAIRFVSNYAGSALPDNVRNVVHEQFTSLPQRFMAHLAHQNQGERTSNSDRETAMREGARGVVILAKDGIQMITHVSDVIDRTIKTAEEWCELMGKDKPEGSSAPEKVSPPQWATGSPAPPPVAPQSQDVEMTG